MPTLSTDQQFRLIGNDFDEVIWLHSVPAKYLRAVHSAKAHRQEGHTTYPTPEMPTTNNDATVEYPIPAIDTLVFRGSVARNLSRYQDYGYLPHGSMRIIVPGQVPQDFDCHGPIPTGCLFVDNPVWPTLGYGDRFIFPLAKRRYWEQLIRGKRDYTLHDIDEVFNVMDDRHRLYVKDVDFLVGADNRTITWITVGPSGNYVIEFNGPDIQEVDLVYPGPERGGMEIGRMPKLCQTKDAVEKPPANRLAGWR